MKKQHSGAPTDAGHSCERLKASFAEIEDVAQRIFARLHRDNHDAAIDDPHGYLMRMAASVMNEFHEQPWVFDDELAEVQFGACGMREYTTAQAEAHTAMHGLPQNQREALQLHFDGLTCAQIAEQLGKPYEAAMQDLTSAYSRLCFELDPLDRTESAKLSG